jgi:hypothetical protein
MNAVGPLLAKDRADRHRSLGAFGKPAHHSHVQLRAMLLGRGTREVADYFARPTLDGERGELSWTAEVPGPVRRLDELAPDARAAAIAALVRIHRALASMAADLRAKGGSGPGGALSFASLLDQATRVPAQGDFLYMVGAQPVIAFWGFEDADGGSVDPAAQYAQPPALAPAPASPPAAAPVQVPAGPPATAPRPPIPAPVSTSGDSVLAPPGPRRPGWLRWLLLGLPLLLLAWWLLRACMPVPPIVIGPDGVPQTEGRKAGRLLEIPPGALERGDLSFLDGVWQLGEDRVSAYAGRPDNIIGSDRIVLRFGRDGTGTSHAVERLRQGRRVADCGGGLQARTDGKKLYFERQLCQVPGRTGDSVLGSQHECLVEGNGKTMCYGVNKDGVRWQAPLARLT